MGRRRDSPERGSAAASSPEQAKTALPCTVWPGIWPRSSRTARVVHLYLRRGLTGLGAAIPTAAADLCGYTHRRARGFCYGA